MFYCERSQVSITRSVVKARANEQNAKLALAFYCECSRGSSARSAVKAAVKRVQCKRKQFQSHEVRLKVKG